MDSLDYATASDSAVQIENQSDNSSSGSSLFKTQCVPYSPKRRQRNSIRKFVHSPESVQARDSSSDSSFEPRPLTLKAIFERFKKKKRKKRKYKPTGRPRGRPKGRRSTRCSQITKKHIRDRGPGFPFLESKNGRRPLPWRKILTFEQAVARGFFNYLEKLKYEYHLKESLKQMNVGEDLEKDDLDSRRYKYLDDDGSLSPIEELAAEDEVAANLEHDDECDIKLVEDSCFIISSELPKKMSVYLEQEEYTGEDALSKKRASKSKNIGQNGLKRK
ncbi:TATA box-binding protein-associated factor RNA polymerase I subunit D isoform X1 [Equus caballus]|uniref:TATA box-binding protein-associated factor RNA polymerase I subunit D n=1 Tax=Equus caballus TaxID=9796 RepID=UPI000214B564|nr:TATA box-binding protein-associated factor RNA polymerase I subunit D [Equus caballus]XP_008523933.1 PREDICTED: TATA box-binding protein-associated factor RNA polymerase I subunit D isoform X1 [Equus przewalskii]XP_008523934.1 PREDICTED: TATA box-binding protein-associated factor RNA polymerase I subunit D isoform X1 [Equus przewalskii]XP_008523935.1 PREDICTED: TATA box-binding protein-associated factor RNA polymerase I subunit D isoform X1 [Equus przewalskii]XP_008523936.1 PREDICTED: TATA b